jgi:hypothetical protein
MSGDASEPCDVGASSNKSFLFLQTLLPVRWSQICLGGEGYEMRSSREVAQGVEEQSHFDSVWCASNGSEKAWGIDGLWPVARLRCSLRLFCRRTNNRNRCLS